MREGWTNWPLGEVADIGAGNSAPQRKECFVNGKMPFIRTSDIGQIRTGAISDSRDQLNEECTRKMRLVEKGSVLVPKSGASTFLNHRVILSRDAYVSSHLATVKAKPTYALDSFIHYFLMTVRAQDLIQDHKYPSLKLSDISTIRVFLPSLPEQKHIVAILDEAFAGIATAVANTEKNLANARELFESYLNTVFSKRGEGWVDKKLGEVCEGKITDGTHQTPKYYDDGFIFLSSRNVKSTEIDWQNIKYVDRPQHEAMQKRLSPRLGDILLAKNGTTGVAAIVDRDVSFDIYVSLALLRPSAHMDSRYLWHFINSPIAKRQFNKRLKGVGVPNLHLKEIREVGICFPLAKSEQVYVVEKLDEVLEEKQKLESIYQQKLNDLAELKQSLLQKAFSGELTVTPQDEVETALA